MAFSGSTFLKALKENMAIESGILVARVAAPLAKDEKPNIFGKGSLAHHKFMALNNAFAEAGLNEKHAKYAAVGSVAAVIGALDYGGVKVANKINPTLGKITEIAAPLAVGSKFINKRLLAKYFSGPLQKQLLGAAKEDSALATRIGQMSEGTAYMEEHPHMWDEVRQGFRDYMRRDEHAHIGHDASALGDNDAYGTTLEKAYNLRMGEKHVSSPPGTPTGAHGEHKVS